MHPWDNDPKDEGGDERHDPEGKGGDESQHEPEGEGDESPSLGFLSSHEDIDDDDYVDIDDNSEDEMRSSFLKNSNRLGNLVCGGPQARDTTGMTDSEKYAIERSKEEVDRLSALAASQEEQGWFST
jgi:hypothetical protein